MGGKGGGREGYACMRGTQGWVERERVVEVDCCLSILLATGITCLPAKVLPHVNSMSKFEFCSVALQ